MGQGPGEQDPSPKELRSLEFLVGKWTGKLEIDLNSALEARINGTVDVKWEMNGHFLVLRAKGSVDDRIINAETRISYDPIAKAYRAFTFFEGYPTAWYSRGVWVGNKLTMSASAVDAKEGQLPVTLEKISDRTVDIRVGGISEKDAFRVWLRLTRP